jgi:fused signal recognition particle receptor
MLFRYKNVIYLANLKAPNQLEKCTKEFSVFKFKKKSPEKKSTDKQSWLNKLTSGLKKTRTNFSDGVSSLVLGRKKIDDELLEELETQLLLADIGIETTEHIIEHITKEIARNELQNPEALMATLQACLINILEANETAINCENRPHVILMVGVNGAGKTTSIAKIAHHYLQQNKKVMLAAGDTFRAAAIEQLEVWGKRNNVPVIAQQPGSDSAAVIYDAYQSAKAKNYDILLADTAGRLHTQGNLMKELQKIKSVMAKIDVKAPHEVMLIVDATMGQNALTQAQQFNDMIGLDSISITKLDGTAKGGIIFSIADKLKIPFRFIGVGESVDDLKPFNAKEFVDALFKQ